MRKLKRWLCGLLAVFLLLTPVAAYSSDFDIEAYELTCYTNFVVNELFAKVGYVKTTQYQLDKPLTETWDVPSDVELSEDYLGLISLFIYDFDGDGHQEMVTVTIKDGMKASIEMYTINGGSVILSDSKEAKFSFLENFYLMSDSDYFILVNKYSGISGTSRSMESFVFKLVDDKFITVEDFEFSRTVGHVTMWDNVHSYGYDGEESEDGYLQIDSVRDKMSGELNSLGLNAYSDYLVSDPMDNVERPLTTTQRDICDVGGNSEDSITFVDYTQMSVTFGPWMDEKPSTPTVTITPSTPSPPKFIDVLSTSPFYDAINWAVEKGITTGVTSTTFEPNTTCTIAQIITFLWRAKGSPTSTAKCLATDVDSTSPYYTAMCWASEKKLLTNFGGTLKSSITYDNGYDLCTRGKAVTYLWKLAGSPTILTSSGFDDVSSNSVYRSAVIWAVSKGITTGTTSTTFSPTATCTRGQIVTFLYRAYAR